MIVEEEISSDVEEIKTPPVTTKKCLYCGSKSTPMWRRGPQGAGTLCNACGVKWKHGKILNGVNTVPTEKKRKRSSNAGQKRKSDEAFAVPAPPVVTWDTASSSSTSESPLGSSPNTSPLHKYSAETLSIYPGEDAVEAAALLTLLKRS